MTARVSYPRDPVPGLPELAMIGRDTIRRADSANLGPHAHETMELCYVERGTAWWWAESELHTVSGGQVYVTWPNELHGGLYGALNPCKLYWLGVPLWPGGQHGGRSFLHLPSDEATAVIAALEELPRRCFAAPVSLARRCDDILDQLERAGDPLALTRLRIALVEVLITVIDAAQTVSAPEYSALVREAIRAMDEHLDEPLSVTRLSRTLGWSVSHVQHRFRTEVGMPPAEWQARRRIGEACRQLERDDEPITAIAYRLGFSSSQYFATAFARVMGLSPRAFRAAARTPPPQPTTSLSP